jgi:predicted membrane-bound spermidine synthase
MGPETAGDGVGGGRGGLARKRLISRQIYDNLTVTMHRRIYILLALLVMISVAVVFFAPSVDLEPTALRAAQAAELVLLAIASVGILITAHLPVLMTRPREREDLVLIILGREPNLVDLNCTRLC